MSHPNNTICDTSKNPLGSAIDSNHVSCLESLRGIAALIVAMSHCGPWQWKDYGILDEQVRSCQFFNVGLGKLYSSIFNGEIAVIFFFVLSGFVLARSARREAVLDLRWTLKFILRRFLRIYPSVFVCLMVFAIAHLIASSTGAELTSRVSTFQYFIEHMVFYRVDLNVVLWTMRLELLAIPVLLLSSLWIRQNQLILVVCLGTLLLLSPLDREVYGYLYGETLHIEFDLLGCFVIGAWIEAVGQKGFPQWLGATADGSASFFTGLLFASTPLTVWEHSWATPLRTLASAGLIASIAYGRGGRFRSYLDHPWLRFLGKTSFSFYLYHPLTTLLVFMFATNEFLRTDFGPYAILIAFSFGAATVVVSLPLGWLAWRAIELPWMNLSNRCCRSLFSEVTSNANTHGAILVHRAIP
jgi:peptidoglycan/LPS O-acetylase OafA/YrhL